ncbi:MAG: hypothetical protein AAF639_44520, partial [Chloroflexota bacterium]
PVSNVGLKPILAYTVNNDLVNDKKQRDIYIIDLNKNNPTPINITNSKDYNESKLDWSPNGQRIIYQSKQLGEDDDDYDIWVMDADGQSPTQLTTSKKHEKEPDWSAKRNQIIYNRDNSVYNNENGEFWIMNPDGSEQTPLLRKNGDNIDGRSPVWSPDGEQIVFMKIVDNNWQIFIYSMLSDQLEQLTDCDISCRFPAWSPKGRYIIFHKAIKNNGVYEAREIGMIELSDPENMYIINRASGGLGMPTWSEDKWVAFNAGSERGIHYGYLNLETMEIENLVTILEETDVWGLEWSR